ncbi:MAG TPA: carboxylesterase/lipase family protein [Bryobacteraceae bacterium]|nr:carboxylesterase/lipase family protein [Bryobacteraceae bacterium]
MNRRSFLQYGTAASFFTGALSRSLGAEPKSGATVETSTGKIRGLMIDKVNAFKGIPYGGSTAGNRRFMPPVKPEAWTGIKDTVEWGPEAPQVSPHTEIPEVRATIPATGMSEDCLRLNVWSNGLGRNDKRPVMVWLHGGGFTSGNGSYTIYDGANLARKRDVVSVTINHRLNSFGFLHLPEIGGAKFAQASNAGMLDAIAALQWVHDNIANFGGDPNNVTIFGQSGGAGKVSTLLAMPGAKGLFHRAIIQSGSNLKGVPADDATKSARALMAKLNVKTAEDLQKVPMDQLIAATTATQGLRLAPVLDGHTLPRDPFSPDAPAISADVPLLIGSTETEVTFFPGTGMDPIDDAALLARVKTAARADDAQAKHLIDLYRKGRPGVSNIDVALIVESDTRVRTGIATVAELKAAKPAPVYLYYFTWRSPVRDGKLKAFHTLEIPFVTENVDNGTSMTGTGQDRYALQDKMSAAWAAFARTGNPNHKGLPNWPKFNPAQRATMIFNNECKVANDPNGEERKALAALRQA